MSVVCTQIKETALKWGKCLSPAASGAEVRVQQSPREEPRNEPGCSRGMQKARGEHKGRQDNQMAEIPAGVAAARTSWLTAEDEASRDYE